MTDPNVANPKQDRSPKTGRQSRPPAALEFKGLTQPMLRAVVRNPDPEQLRLALAEIAPNGDADFEFQAAVIDLGALEPDTQADLAAICAILREVRLNPVGVAGAPDALREQAQTLSLSWLSAIAEGRKPATGRSGPEDATANGASKAAATNAVETRSAAAPTMTIYRPVRSGQQIYARNADLVVIGQVSPGAEVIADGNIHIYGSLQGRAIAGASGRRDVGIFTLDLAAELVAISGVYRTFEEGIPKADRGRPVRIELEGDSDRLAIRGL